MGMGSSADSKSARDAGHPAHGNGGSSGHTTLATEDRGHGHDGARAFEDAAVATMLNAGQQPTFWIVLGIMALGGVAAGVVVWLWLGGPLAIRRRRSDTPSPPEGSG